MRTFTLKGLFLTTVFMLLGCLAIHAADDGLITEQVVVKLDEAGTLPDKISVSDRYRITNLKIIGEINGDDFFLIRVMAGINIYHKPTDGRLSILDLSDARIVEGGSSYSLYNMPGEFTSNDMVSDRLFCDCNSLTSVMLPSNITRISYYAFADCKNLTSLVIPSSVSIIAGWAFAGCSSLKSIVIPSNVWSIDQATFAGCSSLVSIDIPSSVTNIGSEAFARCSSLTSIDIPLNVIRIGSEAFARCSSLTSMIIPSGVTSIDDETFSGCSNLQSVEMLGVIGIGNKAFEDCSSLSSVVIPSGVKVIGDNAFKGCSSLLSIEIPSSLEYYFGKGVFSGCSSMKSIYVRWNSPFPIKASTFEDIDNEACILYVPQGTKDRYRSSTWGEIFENIVEYDATGINHVTTFDDAKEVSRYSVNGQRLDAPTKGLNIVKYSDGSVKKVIVQ